MTPKPGSLRWEDSVFLITITLPDGSAELGWMTTKTHRPFLLADEHHARYYDAEDFPCPTPGCAGRRAKCSWTVCDPCHDQAEEERRHKQFEDHAVNWDDVKDKPILCGERVYMDSEDVVEHVYFKLEDNPDLVSVDIYVAEPSDTPHFSMSEFLCDILPDDEGCWADFKEIDTLVNAWLKEHEPFGWERGVPIRPESLRHLFDWCEKCGHVLDRPDDHCEHCPDIEEENQQ